MKVTQVGLNNFYISNPLDFGRYFLSAPRLTGEISLLNTRVLELSSPMSLIGGGQHPFDFKSGNILSKKVVGGWNLRCGSGVDFSPFAVLVLLEEKIGGGLLFMRLGDFNWGKIEKDADNTCKSIDIVDIVFYKGEFYAFEVSTWHVGIIDPNDCDFNESPSMEFIDAPVLDAGISRYGVGINFVAAKDGLYVVFEVIGNLGDKSDLMVFVLDEVEWEWKRVRNIGNDVFFIGPDVCFAVSAEHLPGWKAGIICLFNEQCKRFFEHIRGLDDDMPVGVECMDSITYPKYWMLFRMFDMDAEEKGVVSFEEMDKEVYTGLFFPPPPWMKWQSHTLDVVVQLHNLKFADAEDHGSANVAARGANLLEEIP